MTTKIRSYMEESKRNNNIRNKLLPYVQEVANKYGLDWRLLDAQLLLESAYNPNAVSKANAKGIAQFVASTATGYGLKDPFDPYASIDAQARLMKDLMRNTKAKNDWGWAGAGYNFGPKAYKKDYNQLPKETKAYYDYLRGAQDYVTASNSNNNNNIAYNSNRVSSSGDDTAPDEESIPINVSNDSDNVNNSNDSDKSIFDYTLNGNIDLVKYIDENLTNIFNKKKAKKYFDSYNKEKNIYNI